PAAPPASAPTPPFPPPIMDDAQRAYLWEIEHHGLLLSRHGFQPWADALCRADREALRRLLAPDFRGQDIDCVKEVRAVSTYCEVVRREGSASERATVARDEFCDRLLQYRRLFSSVPKVSVALMNLAPQKRGVLNGPWQGTCQLRIWGET